jgi:hypothetical protein
VLGKELCGCLARSGLPHESEKAIGSSMGADKIELDGLINQQSVFGTRYNKAVIIKPPRGKSIPKSSQLPHPSTGGLI